MSFVKFVKCSFQVSSNLNVVTDLQYTLQCPLVQKPSSLVHYACPNYVHWVGGQSSRQAARKAGAVGPQDTGSN